MKKIIIALLILAMLPLTAFAKFENIHVNSGDALEDIIAVAETQLGYKEGDLSGEVQGSNDYTKYGAWYGINPGAWCAMFVSWCADQADIPATVIPRHANCDVGMNWFIERGQFRYGPYYGGTYTPNRGDIVYFGSKASGVFDSTHVGIVYHIDGERIYAIEGNSSDKVQTVPYKLDTPYILGYGIPIYASETVEPQTGKYVTTADVLNLRAEPNTVSTVLDRLILGTEVEVTEIANLKWGKITYNGKTGWISLDYCAQAFSVRYDANGGTSAPDPQIKYPLATLILSASKPTRTGYTFLGWSSDPAGEAEYKPGDSYSENVSITLYAVWQISTYTVTYDANGGTSAPPSQIKEYGTELSLSKAIPSRNGYKFKGWSSSPDGEVEYTDTYSGNADITLYAVWEVNKAKFTVTYNANGGTSAPAAQSLTEGDSLVITAAVPSRNGYTFEGWAYSANSKWAQVYTGDVYDKNASVTLYAVWAKSVPSITVTAGTGGRVQRNVSGNTVTMRALADTGNSISYISVDGTPMGLSGDMTEYIITLDSGSHTVKVEFTYNDGLWINPFTDVSKKAWYYKAVEYCYTNNIMIGMSQTVFAPNATLTRAQFVTLLGRLHGEISGGTSLPFTDVGKNSYYYKYLVWAYNNGLVSGTAADKFSPNAPITREQLCVMLYNYKKYKGTVGQFSDVLLLDYADNKRVSSWAREAMAWAVYNKYISGTDGRLLPRNNATRAQAAQIIMGFLK